MERHIIVVTADERQKKLLALLEGEKTCSTWEEYAGKELACERIYVLPIPITKLDKNPLLEKKLKQELINAKKQGLISLKVFGGVFTSEWQSFLEANKIPYWDFMDLPEVVEGNAWITAEATIAEVLQLADHSICGQRILVTGYGCCGEKIAKLFARLGAKVIVVARRAEVRATARKDGFVAIGFEDMPQVLSDVSTVINTVPSMVITEACIRQMQHDSLIVDIASKPGGTDFEAAKRYGIKAKLALGLPGIYTTSSSALLLKNAILKYAPLQENVSEDKSWIFQIII